MKPPGPKRPNPSSSASVQTVCCDPDNPPGTLAEAAFCPANRDDLNPVPLLPTKMNGPSHGLLHHGAVNIASLDPGRALRDVEVEVVWRNRAMVDYIFRNNLYNAEGLAARNQAIGRAMDEGRFGDAHRLRVSFPADSVMLKGSFIRQDVMLALDLIRDIPGEDVPNNPDYPYVTVYLKDGASGALTYFYLVSMTNASKDIPIWHWYALEHVANLGRCDFVGCNDSFGFAADGNAQPEADFGSHFIAPKLTGSGDLEEGEDSILETGTIYDPAETGERMTDALLGLLDSMGVGGALFDADPKVMSVDDPAWRNYRLKGTQTEFVTATGIDTGTGSTVIEGGFVNSSSCLTCHSQAGVDSTTFPFTHGVGQTFRANLFGFGEVVRGVPKPEWFYTPRPTLTVMPTDFVWGVLNAKCIDPVPDASDWVCKSYPEDPALDADQ